MAYGLCSFCGKNAAKFTVEKKYGDGSVRSLGVCVDCARKMRINDGFALREKRCRVCGKSLREIEAEWTAGCAFCYTEFKAELAPFIKTVQTVAPSDENDY